MESWHAEQKGTQSATCMDIATCSPALNTFSQIVFYGVNVQSGNSSISDHGSPLVFGEKTEALQVAKKYKGARFKAFNSKDEAICFAMQIQPTATDKGCTCVQSNSCSSCPTCSEHNFDSALSLEKSSPYKSLKSQDLVKFRKAIESGDSDFFTKAVSSNPKYLISSGDTPSVLQEGFRYNSLHIAARSKQPYLCRLILSTIEDDKFLRLLFCDDSEEIFNQRKSFIVDLYLNMPDKGMCETPLHFACKFGCLKVVEVLLSHPMCDRTRINKGGLTARESICSRSGNSSAKKDIEMLFDAQYSIPVLRSEGNSIQPILGKPFSLDDPSTAIRSKELSDVKNPLLIIKAKAGPMPLNKANDFYKKWKNSGIGPGSPISSITTCISNPSFMDNSIRLRDSDKGLERIGRQLAKEFKVPWTEYWSFLNSWCDISSVEGLELLENRFKEVRRIKTEEIQAANDLSKISINRISQIDSSLSPVSVLCRQLEKFHLSTPQSQSRNNLSKSTATNGNETPWNSSLKTSNLKENIVSDVVQKLNFDNDWSAGIKRKFREFDLSTLESEVTSNNCNNITISFISSIGIVDVITTFLMDNVSVENEDPKNAFESLATASSQALEALSNNATNHNQIDVPNIHKCIALLVYSYFRDNLPTYHLEKVFDICEILISSQEEDSFEDEFLVRSGTANENFGRRSLVAVKKVKNLMHKHLQCILNYLRYYLSNKKDLNLHSCTCSWKPAESAIRFNLDNVNGQITSSEDDSFGHSNDSSSEDEFLTPPTSRSCSPMETPEDIIDIFVQGSIPSKADLDVLHALKGLDVDPQLYPHIKLWMHCVNCYPKEAHKMWESPAFLKARRTMHGISPLSTHQNERLCNTASPKPNFAFSTPLNQRLPESHFDMSGRNFYDMFSSFNENAIL